jgi:hypothetical protein
MENRAPKNIMDFAFKLGLRVDPETARLEQNLEGYDRSFDSPAVTPAEAARMYSETLFLKCGYVPPRSYRSSV